MKKSQDIIFQQIEDLVFSVFDELNLFLRDDGKLLKRGSEILFGWAGKLDSLGVLNLVVATEQGIHERFGMSVSIDSNSLLTDLHSSVTADSYIQYVCQLVEKKGE